MGVIVEPSEVFPGHSLSLSPPRGYSQHQDEWLSAVPVPLCRRWRWWHPVRCNAAKSLLWGTAGLDPALPAGRQERQGRTWWLLDVSAVCWGKVSFGGAALPGVMDVCSDES